MSETSLALGTSKPFEWVVRDAAGQPLDLSTWELVFALTNRIKKLGADITLEDSAGTNDLARVSVDPEETRRLRPGLRYAELRITKDSESYVWTRAVRVLPSLTL